MADQAADEQADALAAQGWRRHDWDGFSGLVGPFWSRRANADGPDLRPAGFGFVAEARHLNGHGIVHGGMLMTFIDQALGRMVWEAIDRVPCATIQLSTYFVEAGHAGDFIEAETSIVRQTRSVIFTRGTLLAGGRTLLTADGVWKVLRGAPAAPAATPAPG